jgi:hypothetical protein
VTFVLVAMGYGDFRRVSARDHEPLRGSRARCQIGPDLTSCCCFVRASEATPSPSRRPFTATPSRPNLVATPSRWALPAFGGSPPADGGAMSGAPLRWAPPAAKVVPGRACHSHRRSRASERRE